MAVRHPALVRAIVNRGHQIGNHGHSHFDAKVVSTQTYVADVTRCQAELEDIVGRELPRNFRPPFGHVAVGSTIALLCRRFRFVFWSLDSLDSFLPDAGALVEHIKLQRIPVGSILLFHDDYAHTTDALPQIVANLEYRALKMVSIDDLVSDEGRLHARRGSSAGF
ncbi:MAG: polysaccharide deacetylase family protein [Betaproteobacteria bacterium]|nr:polysaccharide deacetylase family protein [Betaproteobacteria bacterium]